MLAPGLRTFIGVAELLAAAGLILPAATRILPWLTPLAAAGLMIVMAGAAVSNLSSGETAPAIANVVIFALITFVAYMRRKVYPITPRAGMPDPGLGPVSTQPSGFTPLECASHAAHSKAGQTVQLLSDFVDLYSRLIPQNSSAKRPTN